MIHTILTHPGGAHKDELLACCLMVALHGVPIVRREPVPEDLDDIGTCVIDVGGEHAPARMNFDHHQFPREHPPTCSLSLLLQYLGLYEDAKVFCEWLEPAEWFDCRGPMRTAEFLGVERRVVAQMTSPIDVTMLRRFRQSERIEPGTHLYEMMRYVGEDMLGYLQSVRESIRGVEAQVQTWEIQRDGEVFFAIVLPRGEVCPDEPSGAVARYIQATGQSDTIAAMVYPDRRGEGYGIARYNDHPQLDFTRVGEQPDVHFIHSSGFLLKTTATEERRLKELLSLGWSTRVVRS